MPHVFLKSVVFRTCVELMLIIYVVLAAAAPQCRPERKGMVYAAIAYFGLMLVSSLPGLSANAWSSWWGDFARMDGMITQLHLFVFFLVLASSVRKEREWHLLMGVSVFAGLLMGMSGLVQDLSPGSLFEPSADPRTQGVAGNAGFFAAHLLLNVFVALFLVARADPAVHARAVKIWLALLALVDLALLFRDQQLTRRGLPGIVEEIAQSPGAPAAVFLLHALVLGWFVLRRNRLAGPIGMVACSLFFVYMIQSSRTRGALVGLAAALVFAALLYAVGGTRKPLRLAAVGLLAAVVGLSGMLVWDGDSDWLRHAPGLARLVASSAQEGEVAFRLLTWKASLQGFLDRPLMGRGPENFRYVYDRYFPEELFRHADSDLWADRAHNIFIDTAISGGAPGLAATLVLFGLMMGIPLALWFRRKDPSCLVLATLAAAYLTQGLFWFDSINTYPVLFMILAYVARMGDSGAEPSPGRAPSETEAPKLPPSARTALLVALPAVALCGWFSLVKPFQSNAALVQALSLKRTVDAGSGSPLPAYSPQAVDLFEAAARSPHTGMYEAREEFARYAIELGGASYVPAALRASVARRAIQQLDASILQDPENVRHYQFRAVTVNLVLRAVAEADPGLFDSLARENLKILERAAELSPTRAELHLAEADTLFLLGKNDERLAALEKGAELSPSNKSIQLELMRSYIGAGRPERAASFWNLARQLPLQWERADYDGLVELFHSAGAFAQAAQLLEEQLALGHDPPALLPRLAAAYRDMGSFDLARKTAGRALAAAPQLHDEVRALLESIDRKERENPADRSGKPVR